MKILTLCGSSRQNSTNQLLLSACRKILPSDYNWINFDLTTLPYFDPVLQFESTPDIVLKFRKQAELSNYILISTPEYAHGIPGVLKNALEWLICEETMKKNIVVFVASPSGGQYVKEYLLETLKTMDLIVSEDSTMIITQVRQSINLNADFINLNLQKEISDFLKRNIY